MAGKVIKNFFSEDILKIFIEYSTMKAKTKQSYSEASKQWTTFFEPGIGFCIDISADDFLANALMFVSLPKINETLGLELSPVASFYRVYGPECKLPMHTDNIDYEWSATVNMGYEAPECWPIYVEDEAIYLEPGDCLLYQGAKHLHGRRVFNGAWQTQLFLHYKEVKNEKDGQKDS